MADAKLVRLRNTKTGVVVETTEENAGRLSGFEPEQSKTTTRKSAASSSKSEK